MRTLSIALLVMLVSGCLGEDRPAAPGVAAPAAPTREEVRKRLDVLTSNLGCFQDQDCENIGAGAFPCGGPREFIVFSRLHTDRTELERELARLEEMDEAAIDDEGVSSCQMISRPLVNCVESTCRNIE